MADATPEPRVSDDEFRDAVGKINNRIIADLRATIASQAAELAAKEVELNSLSLDALQIENERLALLDKLATAEAALKAAREALEEVDGCFEAALVEGWADAIASGDVERITDLFNRRIVYARTAAVAALTPKES